MEANGIGLNVNAVHVVVAWYCEYCCLVLQLPGVPQCTTVVLARGRKPRDLQDFTSMDEAITVDSLFHHLGLPVVLPMLLFVGYVQGWPQYLDIEDRIRLAVAVAGVSLHVWHRRGVFELFLAHNQDLVWCGQPPRNIRTTLIAELGLFDDSEDWLPTGGNEDG